MPVWLTDMKVPRVDLVKLPANNAPAGDEGKVTGQMDQNGNPAGGPALHHNPAGNQGQPPSRPPQHVPGAPNQNGLSMALQGLQHILSILQQSNDPASQQLAQEIQGWIQEMSHPEQDQVNDQTTNVTGGANGNPTPNFGAPPQPVPNTGDAAPNAGGRRRQGPLFFPVSNSAIPSHVRRSMASLVRYAVRNGLDDIFSSETIGASELLGDHFREGHDHLECRHGICEAVLTSKERDDLPKTDFAYVDDKGKGHLPLKDAAHVRDALSRFAETDMPESAKAGAMAKIKAAAKRFGIKVTEGANPFAKKDADDKEDAKDGGKDESKEGESKEKDDVKCGIDTGGKTVSLEDDPEKGTYGKMQRTAPAAGGKPGTPMSDSDKEQAKCDYSESTFTAVNLVEATGKPRGSVWDVALIKAGMSLNNNHYPVDVLRSAVSAGLFEGVRAYADHPSKSDQLDRPERTIRDIVGFYKGSTWTGEEVRSQLHVTSPWLREAMVEAYDAGKPDLYGFSIRADGRADLQRSADGRQFQAVKALTKINSVDIVTDPAAGGRTVELLASNRPGDGSPHSETTTSAQEGSMETEGKTSTAEVTALTESANATLAEAQKILAETKRVQFEGTINLKLAESKLPEQAQARVRSLFEGKVEGDVSAAIVAERDYLAAVAGFGVKNYGGASITVGESEIDKYQKAMDGMFDQKDVDGVPKFRGLREAYCVITGISNFDIDGYKWLYESYIGAPSEGGSNARLRESVTTASWTHIFGDSITRKMLKEYQLPGYDAWKLIVSELGSIQDFRTQRRLRMGGYGVLPTVAQGGTYNALTSPTDEEATFAIAKKGGTEQLTMEMLVNDDLGAVRRIPQKLGRAAAMTLYRFVFGLLNDNTTVLWDGLTTYDTGLGHANYTINPLNSDNLTTAKVAMKKQVGYGMPANDTLLTKPKFLVTAPDLTPVAEVLLQSDKLPGTLDNDVNIHKGTLTHVEVNYWTSPRQWFLVADPNLINTFEIGFLNGKQEPELFVQDMNNVGVMFDTDQIKYKIRHIYGGATTEYRGLHGNFAP